MLKIIRFKSVTVVIIGKKIYSSIADRGYKSFIKLEGVTYFETKRKTLTDLGFKEISQKKRTVKLTTSTSVGEFLKKCA